MKISARDWQEHIEKLSILDQLIRRATKRP
jgi:hypothetical protein